MSFPTPEEFAAGRLSDYSRGTPVWCRISGNGGPEDLSHWVRGVIKHAYDVPLRYVIWYDGDVQCEYVANFTDLAVRLDKEENDGAEDLHR